MYADILKQQFSCAPVQTTPATTNNQPPGKRQAMILNYDLDQLAKPSITAANSTSPSCTLLPPSHTTSTTADYMAKLLLIKQEIQELCTILTTAVEQMKNDIASLHANQPLTDMETDAKHSPDTTNHHQPHDLPAIIAELKHDIANSVLKMQALFQKLAHHSHDKS